MFFKWLGKNVNLVRKPQLVDFTTPCYSNASKLNIYRPISTYEHGVYRNEFGRSGHIEKKDHVQKILVDRFILGRIVHNRWDVDAKVSMRCFVPTRNSPAF